MVTPDTAMVTVGEDEDVTGVDFEVDDPAGSVSGAVTAPDDSITIAGLEVFLENGDASVSKVDTTDTEGLYAFDYVPMDE